MGGKAFAISSVEWLTAFTSLVFDGLGKGLN